MIKIVLINVNKELYFFYITQIFEFLMKCTFQMKFVGTLVFYARLEVPQLLKGSVIKELEKRVIQTAYDRNYFRFKLLLHNYKH